MAKYTKSRAARKHQPVENRAGAVSKRRRYAAYDGQRLLGTFILNERTGIALAWDSERRFIGRFTGYQEAARGIVAPNQSQGRMLRLGRPLWRKHGGGLPDPRRSSAAFQRAS
jgi:hypothetical protein